MAENVSVNIVIVPLAADTKSKCVLVLDGMWPSDFAHQGGFHWSARPLMALGSSEGWWNRAASKADRVVGYNKEDLEWFLEPVTFPLSVNQKGTGRHDVRGRFIPRGDIAWKIFSIGIEAVDAESVEFDPSEVLALSER